MNIMDILILIVLVLYGIGGLSKGFIVSAFKLVGFIVAIYIAKSYHYLLSEYIANSPKIFTKINNFVSEKVAGLMDGINTPNSIGAVLDVFKLPEVVKEGVMDSPQVYVQTSDMASSSAEIVSDTLTYMIINIISFIIVFLAAWIILHILINILDGIAQLPVLKQFNKVLGLAFGIVKGILIMYVVFAILTPVIAMFPDGFIAENTLDSTLGNFFYNYNPIIIYIKNSGLLGNIGI